MPAIVPPELQGEFQDGPWSFIRTGSGRVIPLIDEGDDPPTEAHYRRAAELTAETRARFQ